MKSMCIRGGVALLGVALTAGAVQAQIDYGVVIHMTPAGYGGCADLDETTIDCAGVQDVGTDLGAAPQYAWILAYGWDDIPGWEAPSGIAGAQFGIHYGPDIEVSGWALCTGGAEIPQDDHIEGTWPQSETGNVVTWSPGESTTGHLSSSGFAKLGYFVVSPDSEGRITVIGDPRIKTLQFAEGSQYGSTPHTIPSDAYSSADTFGNQPDNGRKSCSEPVPVAETSWSHLKSMY